MKLNNLLEMHDGSFEAPDRPVLEGQQEFMPRKSNESTAIRMAQQMVRAACKHFDGDAELRGAKQMAKAFYSRLVSHIESEYNHANMKSVNENGFIFSLTEAAKLASKEA